MIIYLRRMDVKKYIHLSALGMMLFCCVAAAANNAKVDFTATISEGACEVTLPGGSEINFDNIDPAGLIGQNEHFSSTQDFTVNVKCSGLGPGGAVPKLTLTGEVISDSGASAEAKKLFRNDSGSVSKGFGVAIMPGSTADWSKILTANDTTPVSGDVSATAGVNVPFVSAVACGTTADCAATKLTAGALKAAVTFTFAYK